MTTKKETTTKGKPGKAAAADGLPYEKVVERLEATVSRLEGGELPLEEQLMAFEEGMELLRAGQRLLDGAERRVEKLLADGGREAFGAAGNGADAGSPDSGGSKG